MTASRKAITDNTQLLLHEEADGVCPLCSQGLLYEKNGKKYKNYQVAHIYPLNPTEEEKETLKNVESLSADPNADKNLILLCPNCHNKYDKPKTEYEYNLLLNIKKQHIENSEEKERRYFYYLANEVKEIVQSLEIEDEEDWQKIQYEPKSLNDKFDSNISRQVKRKISLNVSDYFYFVRERLSDIDKENSDISKVIANQVRAYYYNLKRNGCSQEDIFNKIVEWIQQKNKDNSREACEVLVSFFIQNCEVYE